MRAAGSSVACELSAGRRVVPASAKALAPEYARLARRSLATAEPQGILRARGEDRDRRRRARRPLPRLSAPPPAPRRGDHTRRAELARHDRRLRPRLLRA